MGLFYWFFSLLGVDDWQKGLRTAFIGGSLVGIASVLGQYSILRIELELLILWGMGQVVGFAAVGAVLGAGISVASLRSLAKRVTVFVIIAVLSAIVLQSGLP